MNHSPQLLDWCNDPRCPVCVTQPDPIFKRPVKLSPKPPVTRTELDGPSDEWLKRVANRPCGLCLGLGCRMCNMAGRPVTSGWDGLDDEVPVLEVRVIDE